jgi:hypothetical protein
MRIALVGEFSGVHTNLKIGLEQIGHEAVTVSGGDGFKGFGADRLYRPSTSRLSLAHHLFVEQPRLLSELARTCDVIQFIHPSALTLPRHARVGSARWVYSFLRGFRGVLAIAVAGCDSYVQPLMAASPFSACAGCLTDSGRPTCTLDLDTIAEHGVANALADRVDVVVPFASAVYADAYKSRCRRNVDPFNFPVELPPASTNWRNGPLRVLHGITRPGFKGTEAILRAVRGLVDRCPTDYELVTSEQLPYAEYTRLLLTVNVVVDQLYGGGLGMNALSAMARSRIVLSSFDRSFARGAVDYRDAPVYDISSGEGAIVSALETIQGWSADELASAGSRSRAYVGARCSPPEIARQLCAVWSRAGNM